MHWSELTRLVQASASLADPDVRVQFVVDKVAALLAEQDEGRGLPAIQEDDDVPEHAAALFRASFPALAAADPPERLISYYYGSLHTSAVPIKCTLFAGVSSLALLFAPAGLRDPVSIAWTDITSITKQSVLLLLDNAIRIVVSDGRQFVFVTVRRDDCYALLDQLWNNQIALLHKSAATRQLATRRSPELVADADDNADTSAAGDNAALTRHALDRVRLHDNQRRSLHIPPDEKVIYSFQCQLFVPPPKPGNVLGTCLVTSNALCFLSERTREISLVLPFTRITAIEETSSFIGIINTGFTVKTHLAAFKFSAFTRGEHLKQVHGQMALHANKRASLPPPLAPGDPGVLIDRFGRRRWTATADGGGDLEFQAQQHQLEVLWAQYFVSNGVSSDLCVLRRKLELLDLARRGCPNELRANVWSVLSGAAFLSEREPGLFQRLLAERGNEQTKAAREIATDLNRSSNHPFFSRNPEAHESLRRVLVTFSLRNTTIGYCVPEEHEILTNRGFLDLDAYEAAAATDATLLVASYDIAAKALVFEKPNKLVLFEAGTRQLVELSNADEMLHVWSADSDSHGLKPRRSNGVSMLVTKEHDVFAQLGNASVEKNGSLLPDGSAAAHAKIQAGDLLEPTKTYNTVRQLAIAEAGVQKETVPDVCDELGLRTPQQRALFYEIYGFWMGDGTLKYHGPNAGYVVQFAQVKEADNDWLEASLTELDVQYTKSAASKVGQVQITIQSDAWNRCFAAEYNHNYKQAANDGDDDEEDIDDFDADGVDDDDIDVSPTQSGKRKHADASSDGADAVDADAALSNLTKFATFYDATEGHTATALHLQRVRDAVALTNDAIVAPPSRAAAVAPVDAEGRAFDTVSTANGSYMQPEGIKSAKWFASWVWRLGAASLRHVLTGLLRADGNVGHRTIYTSSARFRDEIQRVCLMAGYTAFFRCVYKSGTSRGVVDGKAVIATRDSWAVDFAESDGSPVGDKASNPSLFKARGEIRERQYTGRVWCFNMPSGFIWVRRVAKDEHGVVTKASRPLITGNCQGLNIIAAFLLLYMTEEETFWQLTWIAEVLLPGYFDASLTGARVDQEVFAMLVQHFLPKLHKHLEKIDLTLNVISLAWFMVLFIGYVPDVASARVLDCLFVDGPDVLFQVALAKLAHVEQALLDSADMSVAMQRLRECEIDTETLLTLAYGRFGSLPHDRIDAVRTGQRLATARGLEQSVRDHAIYHSLNEARGEFGDAVTRDEIAAQFDTFSSRISVTSNGSSIDFTSFQRCVRSLCVGMFDAEIVDEFEVIDGDDNTTSTTTAAPGVDTATSSGGATSAAAATTTDVKAFGLREAFDGMSKVRHDTISFREFAALVCLLKFGTIEQQFRFWLRVAAGGGELLERAAVRRLLLTVLSLRFASITMSDVDNLVQLMYHKASYASLRASQAAALASGTLDVATVEELMLREKLLENFAKQMSQIYAKRGEQREADATESVTIGESSEADDF